MYSALKLILYCLVFIFTACATIETPEVKTVEEKTPQVSKTIQQKSKVNKSGLKRKVAIARFSNETRYGQSFFIDKDNDRIGKQAVDILSSKLLETGKFILLERADLEKINKELAMENYTPLRNMADFLIIGSITEFGRKDTGKVGIFSRTKKQTAFAKVHIRLVDVYSGEVIYSEEGEGEAYSEAGTVFGVGGQSGYDSTLNDKALEAAITNLSSNIIENLLDKEWRSYILGYDNGNLIIAGGLSQNIKSGDVFSVIQKGREIKNPQTNTSITLPGKRIAKLKVLSSTGKTPKDEISFCEITEGDLSDYIKNNNFSGLYISEGK